MGGPKTINNMNALAAAGFIANVPPSISPVIVQIDQRLRKPNMAQ